MHLASCMCLVRVVNPSICQHHRPPVDGVIRDPQWEIRKLSALKETLLLPRFVVLW